MEPAGESPSKLRRFALAIGVVLFTYAIAGIELKAPAEISPLGIPLQVRRADLIGIGLVITSLYAAVRFALYGLVLGASPLSARRDLRRGRLPADGRPEDPTEYTVQFADAVSRYFPRALRPGASPRIREGRGVVPALPASTRALIWLENIDYTAPVWVNVVALTTYACTSVGWRAVWSFVKRAWLG